MQSGGQRGMHAGTQVGGQASRWALDGERQVVCMWAGMKVGKLGGWAGGRACKRESRQVGGKRCAMKGNRTQARQDDVGQRVKTSTLPAAAWPRRAVPSPPSSLPVG
jgi:hypothetical protein